MADCRLFPFFATQGLLRIWQISYCENEKYDTCARYKLGEAGKQIPITLLPNGQLLPID